MDGTLQELRFQWRENWIKEEKAEELGYISGNNILLTNIFRLGITSGFFESLACPSKAFKFREPLDVFLFAS